MVQQGNQQMYVMAVDQSTTGSAAFIFRRDGQVVSWARREIKQDYPRPGWVGQDPEEIFQTTLAVSR